MREEHYPRQGKYRDHVKQGKARQRCERADDDVAPVAAHGLDDRRRLKLATFEQRRVVRSRHHPQPGEQGNDVNRKGDEEWIAPSPVEEIGGRQRRHEKGEQSACHDQSERRAKLRNHRVPAAPVLRRIQRKQRGQSIPLSAKRNPLADAKHGKQHRRPDANRVIAWQERDGRRRSAEQEQRDRQLRPAPEHRVNAQEDQRADWARNKCQREDGKGVNGPGEPIDIGKDNAWKHQHRRDRIDEEIEKFRSPSDDHADRNLARRDVAMSCIDRSGIAFRDLGCSGGIHRIGFLGLAARCSSTA